MPRREVEPREPVAVAYLLRYVGREPYAAAARRIRRRARGEPLCVRRSRLDDTFLGRSIRRESFSVTKAVLGGYIHTHCAAYGTLVKCDQ